MELRTYYLVFLRKGPTWSPEVTLELEALQERHLAHLATLGAAGQLLAAGPTQDHGDGTLRGISIFSTQAVDSLEALRALVEADPALQAGRLRAEYATWHTTVELER